jgi:hypothetical protein
VNDRYHKGYRGKVRSFRSGARWRTLCAKMTETVRTPEITVEGETG